MKFLMLHSLTIPVMLPFMKINQLQHLVHFTNQKKIIIGQKKKLDSIVKTTVPVDKLTNFKERINFDNSIIKIDAEGNEFNILKGMDDEIFEKVKFFVLEINFAIKVRENESTFDEIFMHLRSKNFKLAGVVQLNSFVKAQQGDFLFCKKDDNRSYF